MIKLNISLGPIKASANIDPRNGSVSKPTVQAKPKKRKTKPSLNIRF